MRKFVQVSISGKLPRRDVSLYAGGGKGKVCYLREFYAWRRDAEKNRLDYGI